MLDWTIREYTRETPQTRVIPYRNAEVAARYGKSGPDKVHGRTAPAGTGNGQAAVCFGVLFSETGPAAWPSGVAASVRSPRSQAPNRSR